MVGGLFGRAKGMTKEEFEQIQIKKCAEQKAFHDKSAEDLIEWYREAIRKTLEINDRPECDREALNACELDSLLAAVEGSKWITGLPKKPIRNPHREKEHFEKVQNEFLELCEKYGFNAKKHNFEQRPKIYYEDALKEHKALLISDLRKYCKTGLNRAKILAKVLEEI